MNDSYFKRFINTVDNFLMDLRASEIGSSSSYIEDISKDDERWLFHSTEFHSSNLYHFSFCTTYHYYQVDLCILLVVDSMKVLN